MPTDSTEERSDDPAEWGDPSGSAARGVGSRDPSQGRAQGPTYEALVLDVDGTLLNDHGQVPARTAAALRMARDRGVVVMLATGRSERATRQVARELALDAPCVVYNGSGVYCPISDRLIEQRLVPERAVVRVLAHAHRQHLLTVVTRADGQYSWAPRSGHQQRAISAWTQMRLADPARFPTHGARRVTVMSERHESSRTLMIEVLRTLDTPAFLTHFRLDQLAHLRDSPMRAVDVQPACLGKGEALRVLREQRGIAPSRVVAVGDADNDLEMLRGAGLGVAMGNATPDAIAAADRCIGHNTGDALAELIEELWG